MPLILLLLLLLFAANAPALADDGHGHWEQGEFWCHDCPHPLTGQRWTANEYWSVLGAPDALALAFVAPQPAWVIQGFPFWIVLSADPEVRAVTLSFNGAPFTTVTARNDAGQFVFFWTPPADLVPDEYRMTAIGMTTNGVLVRADVRFRFEYPPTLITSVNPATVVVEAGQTILIDVMLAPAPREPLLIRTRVRDPGLVSVPETVLVPAQHSTVTIPVKGLTSGTTTITLEIAR